MAVAAPLSSRDVRRAASQAVTSVQSLGEVVNANAHRLNDLNRVAKGLSDNLRNVPTVESTVWQRLRWLIRGV